MDGIPSGRAPPGTAKAKPPKNLEKSVAKYKSMVPSYVRYSLENRLKEQIGAVTEDWLILRTKRTKEKVQ